MKAQVSDLTAHLNAIERPGTGGGESRVLQTNSHTEIQLGQTDSTFVQRCLAESQKCPSSPASSGIASPLSEVKAITVPPASDIQADEGHAALKQYVEGIQEKMVELQKQLMEQDAKRREAEAATTAILERVQHLSTALQPQPLSTPSTVSLAVGLEQKRKPSNTAAATSFSAASLFGEETVYASASDLEAVKQQMESLIRTHLSASNGKMGEHLGAMGRGGVGVEVAVAATAEKVPQDGQGWLPEVAGGN